MLLYSSNSLAIQFHVSIPVFVAMCICCCVYWLPWYLLPCVIQVEDKFRFVTFVITYAAILVQFILSFLPEPKPSGFRYQLGDDQEV